ncbi:MAG: ABC transporter permease, partial [Acidobacteria bacterium]
MLRLLTGLVVVFLLAPLGVILATSVTTLPYISFPPQGFTLRWFAELLHRDELLDSLALSGVVAAIAAGVSTLLGGVLGVAFVRFRFRGRNLLNAFFMSPLILPSVVIGIALLHIYSQIRMAGVLLSTTTASLVSGHVI